MKIQISKSISAFGGINFILRYLEENKLGDLFESHLPNLKAQSSYSWNDIIYSGYAFTFAGVIV
ncbi:MAG: hypothetical protein R2759_19920 [Bacteroidales bacterium]